MNVVVLVDNFRFQGKTYKKGSIVQGLSPELIEANIELKTVEIEKPKTEKPKIEEPVKKRKRK